MRPYENAVNDRLLSLKSPVVVAVQTAANRTQRVQDHLDLSGL